MNEIGRYILSVAAAGLICGILRMLIGQRGMVSAIGKTVIGMVLAVSVLNPLLRIDLSDIQDPFAAYAEDAKQAAAAGEQLYTDALRESIIDGTTAYILDEASKLGLDIQVKVELSDILPFAPSRITVTGKASPYAKATLQKIMEDDLFVKREDQTWT